MYYIYIYIYIYIMLRAIADFYVSIEIQIRSVSFVSFV